MHQGLLVQRISHRNPSHWAPRLWIPKSPFDLTKQTCHLTIFKQKSVNISMLLKSTRTTRGHTSIKSILKTTRGDQNASFRGSFSALETRLGRATPTRPSSLRRLSHSAGSASAARQVQSGGWGANFRSWKVVQQKPGYRKKIWSCAWGFTSWPIVRGFSKNG